MSKRTRRAKNGQAIIEGVAILWLLVSISVAMILFVIAAGTVLYYKLKLSAVTDAAAEYATQETTWLGAVRPDFNAANVQQKTEAFVNKELAIIGMPAAATVDVNEDLQNPIQTVTVKVKVKGLRLISGNVLPSAISLDDTSVRGVAADRPIAILGIGINNNPVPGQPLTPGKGIYVPSYGAGAGTAGPSSLPRSNHPYYQIQGLPGTQFDGPNLNSDPGLPWHDADYGTAFNVDAN